ncbi:16S rRNA (adenine(1518)-N(6)/adenine(1519)-N(6))-dimethyltransferase RsmA [Saccharicrinis sp. FJH54]|uniref:16S rRNA (adenine(1518)-N(6)/adenine(1519)-N(6))- dimethyltransferase RsmA n=1 Tax=Saccharicrinis sp. FJH54 TaxID=3344665 RepID=UPI0035D40F6C
MQKVRAKKHLGQHFLNDTSIAKRIVDSLNTPADVPVLEIGPGMGVLTQYLAGNRKLKVVEIDTESVEYLSETYPDLRGNIISDDFLKLDISQIFDVPYSIIGNFPYNISSQIMFKVLEARDSVPQVVCMLQREVARRIASGPGNKDYGILSVFLQAYYDIEYLFTVNEGVFTPPPKVKSAVIRLTRNDVKKLNCSEDLFLKVVKAAFNQRRKTLRNSLKSFFNPDDQITRIEIFNLRPEQLTVNDFVFLTSAVEKQT